MTSVDDQRSLRIMERLSRIEAAVQNLSDRVADLEYEKQQLQNQIDNLYLQQ